MLRMYGTGGRKPPTWSIVLAHGSLARPTAEATRVARLPLRTPSIGCCYLCRGGAPPQCVASPKQSRACNMNWECFGVALHLAVGACAQQPRSTCSRAPAEAARGCRRTGSLIRSASTLSSCPGSSFKRVVIFPLALHRPPHAHYIRTTHTHTHTHTHTLHPTVRLRLLPLLYGKTQRPPPPEQCRSSAGERTNPFPVSAERDFRGGLANHALRSMATRSLPTWNKPPPRPTSRRSQHPT